MNSILIVDDDPDVLQTAVLSLKVAGFRCITAQSPREALTILSRQDIALVLMDLNYTQDTTSGKEGLALIDDVQAISPDSAIIVMTGWGSIEIAVACMQGGASDFLEKPWDDQRLLSVVNKQLEINRCRKTSAIQREKNQLVKTHLTQSASLVAQSKVMQTLLSTLDKVAQSDVNILLTGENGTGKSLLAKYIHHHSARADNEFIDVNMGAISEQLFESEMFGHVKGAFTGAHNDRIGRFELAEGGTLFLDEIANTPYSQQAKMLRVLEERCFERVGSEKTQWSNVRIISATNADLHQEITEHRFRQDLLFRLNTITLEVPALRHRTEDILPLAKAQLARIAEKYHQSPCTLDQSAQQALMTYTWPGNVRELHHVLERACLLSNQGVISSADLAITPSVEIPLETELLPLKTLEYQIVKRRVDHFEGCTLLAAKSLGLSRSAVYRRLEKQAEDKS